MDAACSRPETAANRPEDWRSMQAAMNSTTQVCVTTLYYTLNSVYMCPSTLGKKWVIYPPLPSPTCGVELKIRRNVFPNEPTHNSFQAITGRPFQLLATSMQCMIMAPSHTNRHSLLSGTTLIIISLISGIALISKA